jgi:membrane protein YqaA with SNARE-associated domain
MRAIVEAIEAFARTVGGPGLFVIAFLDSSFLSFPQANDLLVIWMVLQDKPWMPYYAAMATLGSLAGCLTLHHLAAKGGEAFLQTRVAGRHLEGARGAIRRHGMAAVFVVSLMPPPAPFKLFVLLSGVAGVPRAKFAAAVFVGRGLRYFGQGILAVWYGDQAIEFLRAHGRGVSLAVAAAAVLAAVCSIWWRRRRAARHMARPGAGS